MKSREQIMLSVLAQWKAFYAEQHTSAEDFLLRARKLENKEDILINLIRACCMSEQIKRK